MARGEAFELFLSGAPLDEALDHQLKCALPFIAEVRSHYHELSELQQQEFDGIFSKPEKDTYAVSPMGYFRIYYDTSGTHAPSMIDTGMNGVPDFIDSAAAAFDYSYLVQVKQLGYDFFEELGSVDPVTGDTIRYDVYVRNLLQEYGFIYGLTDWYGERINEDDDLAPRFRTYILIDNSYDHTNTKGIDGLKVTAAHELHHAIQIGSYGNWLGMNMPPNTRFFYEITSTWMEDVVYPDINDYYFYLPPLFAQNIYRIPFYNSTGVFMYSRGIWGHMMDRRYGKSIMREMWEYVKLMQPLTAINRALRNYGSTLQQELAEFHLWKYYTGSRARPDEYFVDGADYPMLSTKSSMEHIGETMFRDVDVSPQTLHVHTIDRDSPDPVYFLVSNVDRNQATEENFYELTVFSEQRRNSIPVGNDLWYRFESNNPSEWKAIPIYTESAVADARVKMYPNPFRTGQASSLSFVIDTDEDVRMTLFSSDMRLVFQDYLTPHSSFGRSVVRWDGRDDRNRHVASGVYIYVLEYGDTVTKGKVTLIRE